MEQFVSDLRSEFDKQTNEPNMGEQFKQGTEMKRHRGHNVSVGENQQQQMVHRMLDLAHWEEDGGLLELVTQLGQKVGEGALFGWIIHDTGAKLHIRLGWSRRRLGE
jgi:hypothetical protein